MYERDTFASDRCLQRLDARRRLRAAQRDDMLSAARVLLDAHGIHGISVTRIGVHAGLQPSVAKSLYNASADIAVDIVTGALRRLADQAGELTGAPAAAISALIAAMRNDAAAHRIHQASSCGLLPYQRAAISGEEHLLAQAMAQAIDQWWPDLAAVPERSARAGRLLLVLLREAAASPEAAASLEGEAALIADMVGHAVKPAQQPPIEPPRTAEQPAPRTLRIVARRTAHHVEAVPLHLDRALVVPTVKTGLVREVAWQQGRALPGPARGGTPGPRLFQYRRSKPTRRPWTCTRSPGNIWAL